MNVINENAPINCSKELHQRNKMGICNIWALQIIKSKMHRSSQQLFNIADLLHSNERVMHSKEVFNRTNGVNVRSLSGKITVPFGSYRAAGCFITMWRIRELLLGRSWLLRKGCVCLLKNVLYMTKMTLFPLSLWKELLQGLMSSRPHEFIVTRFNPLGPIEIEFLSSQSCCFRPHLPAKLIK